MTNPSTRFCRPTAERRRVRPALSCLGLAALALAGCGGGGDSGDDTPAVLTLRGAAYQGAALASRPVSAKCARGSASGTTGADGSYSLRIDDGALPCVLSTSAADGSTLQAVATGSGRTADAQLTRYMTLVVAHLAGGDPAAYYGSFNAAAATALTDDAAAAARAAVVTLFVAADAGDAATLRSVFSHGVDAAYTSALASLDAAMAGQGLSFGDLVTLTGSSSPANPSPTATPSLPPDLRLRPPASNCASLRSGAYRVIFPHWNTPDAPDYSTRVTVDASSLTTTDTTDGTVDTLVPNGDCRYRTHTTEGTPGDLVISPAGMGVLRYFSDTLGSYQVALVVPEQTHSVAELAATWNAAGMNLQSGSSASTAVWDFNPLPPLTVSAAGNVTTAATTDALSLGLHPTDGFNLVSSAGWTDRYHAYRAGGGHLLLIGTAEDGEFSLWTRQQPVTLPAVGDTSAFWSVGLNTRQAATALTEGSYVTLSVDTAAGSWVRQSQGNGVQETLVANNPGTGYSHRAAGTGTDRDGHAVTINEATRLGLAGMGLSLSWQPAVGLPGAPGTLYFSVAKP